MKFGYARVSKMDQSLDIQIQTLTQWGCDEIFMEKISGARDDRPQLIRLLDKLRVGDTVCVVRLDRLGRRMIKLVDMINTFKEKGVDFVSLDNHMDTSTPMGMVIFSMCAAFAEMERELMRERVKSGIRAAYAKGRKGGRPKSLTPEKRTLLMALKESEALSVQKICTTVGITRSVYYRSLREETS
jgi:DNA invertase Pin-like site-specific DNA recombinase